MNSLFPVSQYHPGSRRAFPGPCGYSPLGTPGSSVSPCSFGSSGSSGSSGSPCFLDSLSSGSPCSSGSPGYSSCCCPGFLDSSCSLSPGSCSLHFSLYHVNLVLYTFLFIP